MQIRLRSSKVLLFLATLMIATIGCDDGPTKSKVARTTPDPIRSLSAEAISPMTVELTWVATGSTGHSGRAASYDIRCSLTPITDSATWADAFSCEGEPEPLWAGDDEHFYFTSSLPESLYYFCIRATNDAGKESGLSNLVSVHLMPLFAEAVEYEMYSVPTSMEIVDIEHDGDSDVIRIDFWDGLQVMLNNGDGTLAVQPLIPFARQLSAADAGDLDGDGDADLVIVSFNRDSIYLLAQTTSAMFELDTAWELPGRPEAVAAVDINGDSAIDLAITWSGSRGEVLLNNGDGRFGYHDSLITGGRTQQILAIDIDSDLDKDLLVTKSSPPALSVLLNDGLGHFVENGPFYTALAPHSLVASDFDSDAIPDVVVTNPLSRSITYLEGMAGGMFSQVYSTDASGYSRAITCGDFDLDGKVDLALANETRYSLTVLFNRWPDQFASNMQLPVTSFGLMINAVDMDGDGDLDLIGGYWDLYVYLNNAIINDAELPRPHAQR